MNMYQTTSSKHRTLFVFAPSATKAVEIVSAWLLANGIGLMPRISLHQTQSSEITQSSERQHLLDAIALDMKGLGENDLATGWLVRPPRDERDLDDEGCGVD